MSDAPTRRALFRWLGALSLLPAAIVIAADAPPAIRPDRKQEKPRAIPHIRCGCDIVT